MSLKLFLDSAVKVGGLFACFRILTSFGNVDVTQSNIEGVVNTHSVNGLIKPLTTTDWTTRSSAAGLGYGHTSAV
jgi:hypothetical protein